MAQKKTTRQSNTGRSSSGRSTSTSGRSTSGSSTSGRSGSSRSTSSRTSSNKRNTSSRYVKETEPMSDELINEIVLIAIGALAVFLFLCNFKILGRFGNAISNLTFGVFGLPNYIMPLIVAFLVIFSMVNQGNSIALRKTIASILLYLNVAMVCELISNTPDKNASYSASDIYGFASTNHKGGGFFGGSLAFLGVKLLGMVGTILLIIAVTIICLIIITNRSFVKSVKTGSKFAYEKGADSARKVREVNDRRRDISAEKRRQREEERRLRKEEEEANSILVSGVKNYSFVKEEEEYSPENPVIEHEDIHEINITNLEEEYDNREIDIKINGMEEVTVPEESYVYEEPEEIIEEIDPEEYFDEDADEDAPMPVAKVKSNIRPESVESALDSIDNNEYQSGTTENASFKNAMSSGSIFASGDHEATNGGRTFGSSSGDAKEAYKEAPKPVKASKPYQKPPLTLLKKGTAPKNGNQNELRATATKLEEVLKSFGVKVTVTEISQGPAVTRYEMIPETGVKVSKIVSLADDIKLNLAAADIRIEAPIPGKAAIGIEVPNKESSAVMLRDLLEAKEFEESKSTISFAVGKDLAGKVVVADIGKMPHMLIAGATGSGKSVCINTLIMSILYKANPDEVKLIMIDPKVVELSVYNGIPHLLIPVVTDPKKASAALAWAVSEMNDRYKKFADYGVRDLKGYNEKIKDEKDINGNPIKPMFKLIVIVDELADMMMVAGKEVEESICRLAQLARAAGIHLILATQRPSVDVITGLIKANMPSRVSFAVSSGVDSRTILDMNGAEKLLGKGDMLFYPQGYTKPARVQGAFVSDEEVSEVVSFLKNQQLGNIDEVDISGTIEKMASSQGGGSSAGGGASGDSESDMDEYFADAGRIIVESGKCSIGMLQRKFKIGFNRAARIMDSLSEYNVVGPEEGTKARAILMTPEEFEEFLNTLNN